MRQICWAVDSIVFAAAAVVGHDSYAKQIFDVFDMRMREMSLR